MVMVVYQSSKEYVVFGVLVSVGEEKLFCLFYICVILKWGVLCFYISSGRESDLRFVFLYMCAVFG
jgi:hypothetical protein